MNKGKIVQEDCQSDCTEASPVINYGGLPRFIGVKIIGAEPMDMNEFNRKFKGMDVSENCENAPGYKVVYEDGYTSWSPAHAFKAYRPVSGMNFGLAIEALKMGSKVARRGWNGKGMFLEIVREYTLPESNIGHLRNGLLPWIGMKTADDGFVPWLASQTDMLCDDWCIVE